MKDLFYKLYEEAVIDAPTDIKLFRKIFLEKLKFYPETYREDFCGTFNHSIEWIKSNQHNEAWAIDLSKEPLNFGRTHNLIKLDEVQKSRIHILQQDVRKKLTKKVDFITAMNFSYCVFKERKTLKDYFTAAYQSLDKKGLFLIDVLGGSLVQEPSEDKRRIPKSKNIQRFNYFWEQFNFDPITSEAKFAIHFQGPDSKKKIKNVFTYDWRMWSLPELRDLMLECGFNKTYVYWEGSRRNGTGNGIFSEREHEEDCLVWIAYLIGEKNAYSL